MMKTPEELKAQALDDSGCCGGCELYNTTVDNPFGCQEAQVKTALVAELVAYTEKLESENADLKSRLAQAKRERDAAVADLITATREGTVCTGCKHNAGLDAVCEYADFDCNKCTVPCMCRTCEENSNYEWRGVREETTHDQPIL